MGKEVEIDLAKKIGGNHRAGIVKRTTGLNCEGPTSTTSRKCPDSGRSGTTDR